MKKNPGRKEERKDTKKAGGFKNNPMLHVTASSIQRGRHLNQESVDMARKKRGKN